MDAHTSVFSSLPFSTFHLPLWRVARLRKEDIKTGCLSTFEFQIKDILVYVSCNIGDKFHDHIPGVTSHTQFNALVLSAHGFHIRICPSVRSNCPLGRVLFGLLQGTITIGFPTREEVTEAALDFSVCLPAAHAEHPWAPRTLPLTLGRSSLHEQLQGLAQSSEHSNFLWWLNELKAICCLKSQLNSTLIS